MYQFKTETRWKFMPYDEIAYATERGEDYSKADLINECNRNEETAMNLLDALDGQNPSTLLEEWQISGLIDENKAIIQAD